MDTHDDELIDLGEIAIETKGPPQGQGDVIGLQLATGLADE